MALVGLDGFGGLDNGVDIRHHLLHGDVAVTLRLLLGVLERLNERLTPRFLIPE
jgi:hypothetical protein